MARGTIRHFKEDGRLYVYLDTFERSSKTVQDEGRNDASKTVQDAAQDRYVASLEDQIRFLRQELERKDAILLRLTERIPELEAAPDPRDAPQTVPDTSEGGSPRSGTVGGQQGVQEPEETGAETGGGVEDQPERTEAQEGVHRPWWRRWFGFE